MRNTRTPIIALATGVMLLTAACSKDAEAPKEAISAPTETPADVAGEVKAPPSAAAPADTPSSGSPAETGANATPAPKAPAAK